jgi:DNA-binding NtrC family response regulator
MQRTTILSVGLDSSLLRDRADLLRSAGYAVLSAHSLKSVLERFKIGDFSLIILCRSILAKDRERLTCLIRASGSSNPVISISDGVHRDTFPNATLDEKDSPQFLKSIREVLKQTTQKSYSSAQLDDEGWMTSRSSSQP